MNRKTLFLVVAVLLGMLLATGMPANATGSLAVTPAADFYEPPSPLPIAQHGSLIRSATSHVLLAPLANARKIMYLSQDTHGRPVATTGTVIVPVLPWIGKGPRPLVVYAVGTIGLGDACAPSKLLTNVLEYEAPIIAMFVARGYSVVVPDYEGLGTPGTHTYLNRAALAHAVLDSVRAAQQLPNVGKTGPVGLIGYSEGGDAVAAAVELKATYVPELNIKGAAVGSAPADLTGLVNFLDGTYGAGFIGYVLAGLAAAYPDQVNWSNFLNDAGMKLVTSVQNECLYQTLPKHLFMKTSSLTKTGESVGTLMTKPPFTALVASQRLGMRPPTVPVFVGHSPLDDIVPFGPGRQMARNWCDLGGSVEFKSLVLPTHVVAVAQFGLEAFAWLDPVLVGAQPKSNCGSF